MKPHESTGRHLAKTGGRLAAHAVAIVVGVMLMIAGLGLGVTLVALPLGLTIGVGGLMLFLWGLFAYPDRTET
jgi:hypothetical protein